MSLKIGVITVSDRASKGIYEDISGVAIKQVLSEFISSKHIYEYIIIPDEQDLIEKTLIDFIDTKNCHLVVTTGGTGPAKRDVTPEATLNICDKEMIGFGEIMRATSLKYVPTAILSRQTAGIRNNSFILNLPGKPKAIRECLEAVFPAIPYCLDLIEAPYIEASDVIKIFRPKNK